MGGDVSRRLREELSKTGGRKLRESSGAIDAIVECLDAFEDRQDQDDARIRRLEESKEKLWGRVSLIEATAAEQRGIVSMVRDALIDHRASIDRALDAHNESLLRVLATRDNLRLSGLKDDGKTPSVKPLKIGPVETKLPVWSIMVLAVFGIVFLGFVAGVAYVSVERIRQQGQTTSGK